MKKVLGKNNKGFTLIELLATIAILSVVVSISLYISLNVIKAAKEKSYQVTITNIEKNANTYVTENNREMLFIPAGVVEYQCITVGDLVDMDYLDTKVTESPVSDNEKVQMEDYIYIQRNATTKALEKSVYAVGNNREYASYCGNVINASGIISFTVQPSISTWSKTKNVTITYTIKNGRYEDYKFMYRVLDINDNNNKYKWDDDANRTETVEVDREADIYAEIRDKDDQTIAQNTFRVEKFDIVGPVITSDKLNKNVNDKVTITVNVDDDKSGVNPSTVDVSDFNITIGGFTPTKIDFKPIACNNNNKSCKYEITITDSEHSGDVVINIPKDSIEDNVGNGNDDTNLPLDLTMNNVYELSNSAGTVTGYTATLTKAFENVPIGGTIKALMNNTSSVVAANNKNNITLNTNGKTITLNKTIINSSAGITLTINGNGTITTASNIVMLQNSGTLTTTNVTLSKDTSASYIISNSGIYNANSGTKITSSSGLGIAVYTGTVNLGSGASVMTAKYPVALATGATGNVTLNVTGATITSVSTQAINISASSYTTNVNISSGTITAGDANNAYSAIYASGAGTKNITITGGTLRGYNDYGVYLNTASVTLTLGTKDTNTPLTSPVIIGATYGVWVHASASWKWYDGYLYGKTSTGNYSKYPNDLPSGYAPMTVSDTKYATGGYRSYLTSVSDAVYELSNSSGVVTEYTNTLTTAFANVPTGGTIKALKDNTSSVAATNNKNNITLNTNGKTITINKAITNSSDMSLTINGNGTITSIDSYQSYIIINDGNLTTSNVTLRHGSNSQAYVVRNTGGTYTSNAGTNIISNIGTGGRGIGISGGTLNLTAGSITTTGYGILVNDTSNSVTLNISGGAITSSNSVAIYKMAGEATVTTNITGGTITSTSAGAINFSTGGSTNLTISGGTITGTGGISLNNAATATITGGTIMGTTSNGIALNNENGTLTLGTKNATILTTPHIVAPTAGKYAVVSVGTWNWYDGYLYGKVSTGNYSANPADTPTGYSPVTIVETGTTYGSGLFKSYLSNVYKITVNANGGTIPSTTGWTGTGASATKNVTYNTSYGTLPTPTRTGYGFAGWYTDATNGTQVLDTTKLTTAANQTLYAHWTANTYTISYTLNGGANPSAKPTSGTYDANVNISNPTKTVTITGDANGTGATVGTATSKAQTFAGWTSTTMGSNAKTGTKSTEVTTAWAGASTKNTYFKNLRESGTVTMIANWTPVALNLPTLSKPGYACKWYSASGNSGGTELGAGGATYTPTANSDSAITVYARCTANSYAISYTLNGGANPSAKPTSGTYDANVNISNPTKTITITGNANGTGATVGAATSKAQTFAGWTSTTMGSNAKTGTSTTNVTTAWTGTSTKNTYFKNLRESGTVTMIANWTPVALNLPTLSKPGYACKWYSASGNSGGTELGAGGATYTPTADSASAITVYARCTVQSFTLTASANDGGYFYTPLTTGWTGNSIRAEKTLSYNSEYGTLPTLYRYECYGFNGWYDAQYGGNLVNSTTKITEDTTIYAHWTYDYSCGSSPQTTTTKASGNTTTTKKNTTTTTKASGNTTTTTKKNTTTTTKASSNTTTTTKAQSCTCTHTRCTVTITDAIVTETSYDTKTACQNNCTTTCESTFGNKWVCRRPVCNNYYSWNQCIEYSESGSYTSSHPEYLPSCSKPSNQYSSCSTIDAAGVYVNTSSCSLS